VSNGAGCWLLADINVPDVPVTPLMLEAIESRVAIAHRCESDFRVNIAIVDRRPWVPMARRETEPSLSDEPILLFLHGVGKGDQEDAWRLPFEGALAHLGYPDLSRVKVIAPKYAHALKGWDIKEPLPGNTNKQLPREAAKKNRRDFERRIGAVEFRLGRHNRGNGVPGIDAAVGMAVGLPYFEQARNYLRDPQIRAQVLNRILMHLPQSGKLVIVGHSLGSVIAADLVSRLPIGTQVGGMVTIGSPLANGSFSVDKIRETLEEPPTNLAWWVNFWNAPDPVAAHRGVSSVFPWMLDFRIDTKSLSPLGAHAAIEYLADETVAAAIGFGLFGSRSKEVDRIDKGVDIPIDAAERIALLTLRYAHLIARELDGDQKDRYSGALRQVQATVVDDIKTRNASEKRSTPSAVARLAFDLADSEAALPEPFPSSYLAKDEAIVLLTILATDNVVRPFEIATGTDKQRDAMKELTAEMGMGSQFGAEVFAAVKDAQEALSGSRGVNWIKWGALGAGAVALFVATGGLALAAAPGLAGAAVITSALASFGPGGMIGGLLTAGSLVTAGGGGIAFGLASPRTTVESLEAVVVRRLASAMLRKRNGFEPDPNVWKVLAETEIRVRREHERQDEFSDASSPALRELIRKIDTIEHALKYLSDNGLDPSAPASSDHLWFKLVPLA
jgi:pimeloyl-ACP methyl ester carboxylesterase